MTKDTINLVKDLLQSLDPGEESFREARKGSSKHKKLIRVAKSTVDFIDKMYDVYDALPPRSKENLEKKAKRLVDKFKKQKEKVVDDPSPARSDSELTSIDSYNQYLISLENTVESNKLISYSRFLNEKIYRDNHNEIVNFIESIENLSEKINKHS